MSPAEDHGCRCWVPVCLGRTRREAGAPVLPAGARGAEGSVAGVLGKLFLRTFFSFFLRFTYKCAIQPHQCCWEETARAFFKNEIFKRFHPTPLHFILEIGNWNLFHLSGFLFFFFLLFSFILLEHLMAAFLKAACKFMKWNKQRNKVYCIEMGRMLIHFAERLCRLQTQTGKQGHYR